MNKIIQEGILVVLLLSSLFAQSANDKIMNYLRGSDINVTNSLSIIDQQHAGFFVPNVSHTIKESYITTLLRYEESLLPLFGISPNTMTTNNFTLTVTYTIDLTDINNNVTTITSETLSVNYYIDNQTFPSYKDIDVKRYKGFLKGEITITNVEFKDGIISHNLADIPNDVYLELSSDVERYYELENPISWKVYPNDITTTTVANAVVTAKNELPIKWDYVLGAESFDVEWVFVDISDIPSNLLTSIQTAGLSYNWKNATRINTTNNFYNISMAYPSGMLIYRVRPVGVDLTNFNLIVNGDWSDPGTTTNTTTAWNSGNGNGFIYLGLEGTKNWTYNVAYAEDGKRKEGISYFDGSARTRQEVTVLNSDNNAIVAETMYDFEGRPAVSFLPTPLPSSGIKYYENGTGIPFNGGYSKNDFDKDIHHISGPDDITNAPSTSITNEYYDVSSSSTSLFADFIPDALNYPFSRTTYKRDGTDRIAEQTGVGSVLMHGTNNTTKYYYGTPAAMEIERLFGNEVGEASFYQKNMVKDPNGQVSIQYLDKEGRTIATSLSGTAVSPLLDLDYKPAPITITADLLSNNTYTPNSSKSIHVLTIPSSTQVNFTYNLTPKSFSECIPEDEEDPLSSLLSIQCSYVLNIQIFDENEIDVLSGSKIYTGYFDGTTPVLSLPLSFSYTFPIGTYRVVKTLTIDDVKRLDYLQDFEDYVLDNLSSQTCVPYNLPPDESCNMSCEDFCEEAFRDGYYDELTDTWIYTYYDENGDVITPNLSNPSDPYFILIEDCKTSCEEEPELAESICEIKYNVMKQQMSLGGQYFDNLPSKYVDTSPQDGLNDLDVNGEPTIVTTYYTGASSGDINDWMENTISTNPACTTCYPKNQTAVNLVFNNVSAITGVTYDNWDKVRNDWYYFEKEGFADLLILYHPEYCAYYYNCIDDYDDGSGVVFFDRSHVLDYEYYMMSGGTDYNKKEKPANIINPSITAYMDFLNPTGISPNYTTDNGANADNSNYMDAISGTNAADDPNASPSNNFWIDPVFETSFGFQHHIANGSTTATPIPDAKVWIENRLKNFLPVDGSGPSPYVAPTKYHSIWYVMEDPAGIHQCTTATQAGVSTQLFDLYNSLHGNSSLSIDGILDNSTTSPNPAKMNRYQFFRGVYKFYRDFILYHLFKETSPYACYGGQYTYWNGDVKQNSAGSTNPVEIDVTSYDGIRDQAFNSQQDWFQLVWPRNLAFDLYEWDLTNAPTIVTTVSSLAQTTCQTDCSNNAQDWINNYSDCIQDWVTSNSLTSAEETQLIGELKADLIEICQLGCSVTLPNTNGLIGSSSGDATTLLSGLHSSSGPSLYNYLGIGFPSSSGVATFSNLMAYYNTYFSSSCNKTVIYPDPILAPSLGVKDCNCANFNDYITNASHLYLSYPLIPSDSNTIKTGVNNLSTPTGNYFWEDIVRWDEYCKGNYGDIIDLPASLECIDCKCENLAFFINSRFDDPNATPTPIDYDPYNLSTGSSGEAADVADLINNEFGTSLTHTDITNMMTACGSSSGTLNSAFVNLPNFFRCNEDQKNVDPALECAEELNNDKLLNYLNLWNQQFASAKNSFYDNYTSKCMEGMNGSGVNTREEFTADYPLNEFMYTLYYYDQAGNLIKTVPPEGVVAEATGSPTTIPAFYTDVDNHRLDPGLNAHQNVEHTLVTQYKYDSYNNLIWQSTPDGGVTNFWYDKLGRLILSQNAKQEAAANYVYSYTLYDALGRIYEVGEIQTTTEIDDDILAYYQGEFLEWVTGGTGTISAINYPTTTRTEVTSTYYDEPLNLTVDGYFTGGAQKELRTRVSSITREAILDVDGSGDPISSTYDYGTHFSYDIHGNVKEIIQENNYLNVTANAEKKKRITYEYDLISGNVNKVNYQPGRLDQYYHRYCYDADNRIVMVETSRDNYIWDTDAKYFYYEHGPLARVEIGEKQVAGSDYAYTLQGWIKGINSNTLNASLDIGNDAEMAGGLNEHFATDAYSYSLGYFDDDYAAANTSFLANTASTDFNIASPSLYNGNIRHMVTALLNENEAQQTVNGVAYRYDQANRIRQSNVFTGVINNDFTAAADNDYYKTSYHYDLNGNITELNRYEDTGTLMDSLRYLYANNGNGVDLSSGFNYANQPNTSTNPNTNRLMHVDDFQSNASLNATDIDDYGAAISDDLTNNNYKYDKIGQLIKDDSEDISEIVWDVYNKIKEIKYTDYTHDDIEFKYDPSGNRIAKILKEKNSSNVVLTADNWEYYFYSRDASGNVMSVYQQEIEHISGNLYKSHNILIEKDIYGSSRLGTDILRDTIITDFSATFSTTGATIQSGTAYYSTNRLVEVNSTDVITVEDLTTADINITIQANDADIIFDFSAIPDYTVTSGSLNVSGGGELYLSANQRVSIEMDGYQFAMTTSGKGAYIYPNNGNSLRYSSPAPLSHSDIKLYGFDNYARVTGEKVYEKSNHLGNVHVVISDRKLPVDDGVYDGNGNQTSSTPDGIFDYYEPDVVFAADYYDGVGMVMPGRLFVTQDHRYGAQGSEVDQEIDGTRDRITTYYRQGNLKTMRWDSPDPKTNASWSPYAMMQGNPVWFNDPMGDTISISFRGGFLGLGKKQSVNYEGGSLFNKDGSAYGGKTNGFLGKSLNALNTIRSTKEGGTMLEELESSKNVFSIEKSYKNEFVASAHNKAYENQFKTDPDAAAQYQGLQNAGIDITGGSGGTIFWNPNGGTSVWEQGGKMANRPSVFFGHELFHGLDANRGLLDSRTHSHIKVTRSEWQAVYRENVMRSQMGLPLRTHYIDNRTPDGISISPGGPFMLTPQNKPLKPSWYKP